MHPFPYPTAASVRAEWAAANQRKANQAAADFELTEAQYAALSKLHVSHLATALQNAINFFDFDRRPIAGVHGSVSPLGMKAWQDAWLADLDIHMKRAWAAMARANERYGRECAA